MLKIWMEEYLPGYFIKYDGFRDSLQYTVLSPEGRVADVETLQEAHNLLTNIGGYYGSTFSCKIHYPLKGDCGKYYIVNYKELPVCVMVEYLDGYCIVDLGGDDGMKIVHKLDLT